MSHYAQLSSSFHAFMGLCSILLMTLAVCFMITSLLHGFSRKSQWIGGVLCCLCILFMQTGRWFVHHIQLSLFVQFISQF